LLPVVDAELAGRAPTGPNREARGVLLGWAPNWNAVDEEAVWVLVSLLLVVPRPLLNDVAGGAAPVLADRVGLLAVLFAAVPNDFDWVGKPEVAAVPNGALAGRPGALLLVGLLDPPKPKAAGCAAKVGALVALVAVEGTIAGPLVAPSWNPLAGFGGPALNGKTDAPPAAGAAIWNGPLILDDIPVEKP
jgi:hypothetical protein